MATDFNRLHYVDFTYFQSRFGDTWFCRRLAERRSIQEQTGVLNLRWNATYVYVVRRNNSSCIRPVLGLLDARWCANQLWTDYSGTTKKKVENHCSRKRQTENEWFQKWMKFCQKKSFLETFHLCDSYKIKLEAKNVTKEKMSMNIIHI